MKTLRRRTAHATLLLPAVLLLAACTMPGTRDRCYGIHAADRCYGLLASRLPFGNAQARLQRLYAEDWAFRLADNPVNASVLGEHAYDDRWPELSPEAFARRAEWNRRLLAELRDLASAALPEAAAVDRALFERQLRDAIADAEFRRELMPIDDFGGVQLAHQVADYMPFAQTGHFEAWIARLDRLGAYIDQHIATMRSGIAAGVVPPRRRLQAVPAQIRAQLVERVEDSPYYAPFRRMPAGIDPDTAQALRERAADAIRASVLPAYQRLLVFVEQEYLPACRDSTALRDLPDGLARYRDLVARHTTTTLTPEQIHAIGQAEVSRLGAELQRAASAVSPGLSPRALAARLRAGGLDAPALRRAYESAAKRIDGALPRLFGRLPRAPYAVQPVPAAIADWSADAYYRAAAGDGEIGTLYVNLSDAPRRPAYTVEALTAHEAVPGHHLQLALAAERRGLPAFRRHGGYSAFVEGWAQYAESLGAELGLYQDPSARFGAIERDLWQSARVVADTGIHLRGWSPAQAAEYLRQHTTATEPDIAAEIERIIARPGQALAGKIGERTLRGLRQRAEQTLGAGFDPRQFHDAVLEHGAIALDLLEQRIGIWLQSSKG